MAAVKNILPAPDPERVHHATASNDYWDTVCAVDTRHTWCHGRASRDQQRGPLGQTSMLHFPNPSISKTNCRLSRLPSAATSRSGEQDNTTFLLGLIRRRQDTSNHTDESGHACVGMCLFYLSPPPLLFFANLSCHHSISFFSWTITPPCEQWIKVWWLDWQLITLPLNTRQQPWRGGGEVKFS